MTNRRASVDVDSPSLATAEHQEDHQAQDVFTTTVNIDDLAQMIKNVLHGELAHMISDIERRYDMALEAESGGLGRRKIGVNDLNLGMHFIEGYTVTSNSPGVGNIAWTNVRIVYNGVDYTISDGSTSTTGNRYVWFVKPATYTAGTPIALSQGNIQPTLANGDTMVFVNNAGVPTSALERSGSASVVDPGAVNNTSLATGAVLDVNIGGVIGTAKIPVLDAATKLSGTVNTAQIPVLDAATKLSGTVNTAQIPVLDAATKLSGTVNAVQIPVLDAATKLSGTVNTAQIPVLGPTKLSILTHFLY